ncbi:MAG: NifU family protein [Bacteroidota bacterium]
MSETSKTQLITQIDAALDEVRPHLAVDGGNIEVVDVTDDMVVQVKWLGSCESCSMSAMTMRAGVEQAVKGKLPQIQAIKAVNGLNS